MVEKQRARAADPGAEAMGSGKDLASEYSTSTSQVYDDVGHRLPERRRGRIEGSPRLAQPGWYRLAANRWAEVAQ